METKDTVNGFVEAQLKELEKVEAQRTYLEGTLTGAKQAYLDANAKWKVGDKVQARPYGSCATVRNYIVKERFVAWRTGREGAFLGKMKISYRMQILKSDGTEHKGRVSDFVDESLVIGSLFVDQYGVKEKA